MKSIFSTYYKISCRFSRRDTHGYTRELMFHSSQGPRYPRTSGELLRYRLWYSLDSYVRSFRRIGPRQTSGPRIYLTERGWAATAWLKTARVSHTDFRGEFCIPLLFNPWSILIIWDFAYTMSHIHDELQAQGALTEMRRKSTSWGCNRATTFFNLHISFVFKVTSFYSTCFVIVRWMSSYPYDSY